MPQTV